MAHADPEGERIRQLEELFTFFQQTVQQLHEEVLDNGRRIEHCEQALARFEAHLRSLANSLPEERDPEDEKPPHY